MGDFPWLWPPCSTPFYHQVGLLYEEGVRKAQSSDSSKRTFSVYSSSRQQGRYAPSYTPRSGWSGEPQEKGTKEGEGAERAVIPCLPQFSAPMDTNLLSNIQKLFSERIDVFSPVEFNKVRLPA